MRGGGGGIMCISLILLGCINNHKILLKVLMKQSNFHQLNHVELCSGPPLLCTALRGTVDCTGM